MTGASPLWSMDRVTAGYRDRPVLDQVSFDIAPGQLWAVLGPNGAGKSTLVRTGLGLLHPASGEVRYGGRPLPAWGRPELARKMAWVPQSAPVSVGFTGMELVLMGRAPHLPRFGLPGTHDLERARALMAELECEQFAGRDAGHLSGGERRLLFLARALLQDPELLWLDEPTAFLDLRHQVLALERVRARVRQGMAAVAVLHDVNLAAAYADRVLLLRGGKVHAQGPTHEVLTAGTLESLYGVPMTVAHTDGGQPMYAPRME